LLFLRLAKTLGMRCALLSFLLFVSVLANGQFWEKAKYLLNDTVERKKGLFIVPLIYYTPDTRGAIGAAGVYYFNLGKDDEDALRPTRLSYAKLLADYTQNRQLDIWTSWSVFTNKEKYLFKGELRYRNFPDRYYSIGNNTSLDQEEYYAYDLFHFKILAMRKLGKRFFAGLDYQLSYEYNFRHEPGAELIQGNITGWNGGTGSGVGMVASYDSRDNVVSTYKGMILESSVYFFGNAIGSDFSYTNLNLQFAKFWEVKKDHVIAVNAVSNFNFGGVPFLDMAKVGGDDILRGYAKNRFRDHHFTGVQIEYRFPVWWRFGMVVFGGVGDVYSNPSDITFQNLKYSVGAGIRFSVNRRERLSFRFDYGFGNRSSAFYIMVAEAF
jgi:hemolysin activation/secretion protein